MTAQRPRSARSKRWRALLRDPLFLRICVLLYGVPIAGLGFFGLAMLRPDTACAWAGWGFLGLIAAFGSYMIWAAIWGSRASVSAAGDGVSDGGELLGVVVVVVVAAVALPLTCLIRWLQRRRLR